MKGIINANIKKSMTFINNGQYEEFEKGQKLIRGSNCPRCKKFYPFSFGVTICNKCGYRVKTLKPHQLKKKNKMLRRKELNKNDSNIQSKIYK